LTLIELLIDSLTVIPFFAAKTFYEELDINNVCVPIYISRSANHNINDGIDALV